MLNKLGKYFDFNSLKTFYSVQKVDKSIIIGYRIVCEYRKMVCIEQPRIRPSCATFSSGPCAKRPGWSCQVLSNALLGRSHRSIAAKKKIELAVTLTRDILQVPDTHYIAIVPASDTGAVEMALWSLLGARGVDIAVWESFGEGWAIDITQQLKLEDVRIFRASYGELPDLSQLDFSRDVVFTWNGTTSGVRVPDAKFIHNDREGLVISDATSAAFAQRLDFQKLDVVTYSWQKVLGGEGAHGILILGPRAIDRLQTYQPIWPLPKIFRLTKNGLFQKKIFQGETINTPSMLCIEDYIDALIWAKSLGGLHALIARTDRNFSLLDKFVQTSSWLENLARVPQTRSNTSVCLKIVDPLIQSLLLKKQVDFVKALVYRLEQAGVAHDISAHRDAPVGLRIWTGPTIEAADIRALTLWLDWAFWVEKTALC